MCEAGAKRQSSIEPIFYWHFGNMYLFSKLFNKKISVQFEINL